MVILLYILVKLELVTKDCYQFNKDRVHLLVKNITFMQRNMKIMKIENVDQKMVSYKNTIHIEKWYNGNVTTIISKKYDI